MDPGVKPIQLRGFSRRNAGGKRQGIAKELATTF